MKKILILFDLDCTLTLPRQHIQTPMKTALEKLILNGINLGVVSGSDYVKIKE